MKLKLLVFIVLSIFLLNCGKKDEQPQTDQQQQQNTQQQQQNTQQQTEKKDTVKTTDAKKEDEKQKEEEKKKEELTTDDATIKQDIDFAPIFAKRCVKCHGKDGTGKVEGVPNLTLGKTKSKTDKEIISIITNGKQGETEEDEDMPSFKNKLSEEEIKAAVKYVKGL